MKLTDPETRWLLTIFDAILPAEHAGPLKKGAADLPIEGFLADLFASAGAQFLVGLRAATWTIYWTAPSLVGVSVKNFGALSNDERAEVLERLAGHSSYALREMPMLVKMVACMAYCADPSVQKAAGQKRVDSEAPAWTRGETV